MSFENVKITPSLIASCIVIVILVFLILKAINKPKGGRKKLNKFNKL